MRGKSAGIVTAVVALMLGSGVPFGGGGSFEAAGQQEMAENPFFTESTLPYRLPPFDRIDDAHYGPAFDRGMAEHIEEIEAIASVSDPPTFENTIVPFERSGRLLDRVAATFFSLASAHTNDAINEIRNEMAPRLAAHTDRILLNADLFARMQALYDQRESLALDDESRRLIQEYYVDFVRAGARLSESEKERMQAINAELATLSSRFTQNVLDEVNASAVVVETEEELIGLSENQIASAVAAAAARGLENRYVIPLLNTSGQPALSSLDNRDLRERIARTSLARGVQGGEYDNREVITTMARLRAERAAMLGYPNHAAYILERQTAQTVEAVNERLASLAPPAVANAEREAADLQAMANAEGADLELAAWDWSYYTEKVRADRYAFDASQLRPYLEMDNVIENGVFFAANQLYGLTFEPRPELPVYQSDVRVWEVFDADGEALGLFLGDYYARPSKRGGAWMNAYVSQSHLLGTSPVVANHLNVPKPPAGEPTLLTFDEVTTLFHEFGHALHGFFSNVEYPYFAGTSVPRVRRVPVAGQRDVGHLAGGAGELRRPPRDRRADAGRPAGAGAGDAAVQPGIRHHGVPRRVAARPGVAPDHGRRGSGRRRCRGVRGGCAGGGGGRTRRGAAALPQHLLLAHLEQRLLGRVLLLHLERGARRRLGRVVQGERRSAARQRRPLPADSVVEGGQRRRADALPRLQGRGPGHTAATGAPRAELIPRIGCPLEP